MSQTYLYSDTRITQHLHWKLLNYYSFSCSALIVSSSHYPSCISISLAAKKSNIFTMKVIVRAVGGGPDENKVCLK